LLRVALEGRTSIPVVHRCGWDSGAARERSSALAASVASRYALSADGVGAAAPGRPWQPGHCLALRARRRRRGGAARPRAPTSAPRVTAHVVSWGEWGCRRSRVLRAAREARCKACFELLPRAVWGGTPRGPCCHRLRHARAEHRYGGSCGKRAARERRRRRSKVSRRRRAGHAPPARRGRRVRVPRAVKRPAKTLCGGGGGGNSELPQAGFP